MRSALFGLLWARIMATAVVLVAGSLHEYQPWARDVCDIAGDLCDNFRGLAIAVAVMAILLALVRMMET